MIRISTKTRYALRSLLEMACSEKKKLFQLSELSRHQNISRKYLENIFAELKRNHIVYSRVGKNGGFYLPANIKEISLLHILEALEGPVEIVTCRKAGRSCERLRYCPANSIWKELNSTIRAILSSKNLKDLSRNDHIKVNCLRSLV